MKNDSTEPSNIKTPLIPEVAPSAQESDFQELKRYNKHKYIAVSNSRFVDFLPRETVARRVRMCGSYLLFERWLNRKDPLMLQHLLTQANFCKNRFCPLCSWRKSQRFIAETLSRIKQLGQSRQIAFLRLTLTAPNPPIIDLNASAKLMSKAWHKFSKYKAFKQATLGWVRCLELIGDKTPEGQAHPHYHVLVVVPTNYFSGRNYIKQEQWRAMWERAYGRKNLQVDVARVRPRKINNAQLSEEKTVVYGQDVHNMPDALIGACCEIIKYNVKPAKLDSMSDDDLRILIQQARGLRQYDTGGELAEFEPQFDELNEDEWELIATLLYRWGGDAYSLEHVERPKCPLKKGELPPLRPVPDYNSFSD